MPAGSPGLACLICWSLAALAPLAACTQFSSFPMGHHRSSTAIANSLRVGSGGVFLPIWVKTLKHAPPVRAVVVLCCGASSVYNTDEDGHSNGVTSASIQEARSRVPRWRAPKSWASSSLA